MMISKHYYNDGLIIATIDLIPIKNKSHHFCGTPHLLLKYSKYGTGNNAYDWPPLSIELALTDDDDFDIGYQYHVADEEQFDEIIAVVLNWMRKIENIEISTYDIFDTAPMQELLERCF